MKEGGGRNPGGGNGNIPGGGGGRKPPGGGAFDVGADEGGGPKRREEGGGGGAEDILFFCRFDVLVPLSFFAWLPCCVLSCVFFKFFVTEKSKRFLRSFLNEGVFLEGILKKNERKE